jgi:hypothetical protein
MRKDLPFHLHVKLFLVFTLLVLSGCSALQTKPDSCDLENGCDLSHPSAQSKTERLNVAESKTTKICACNPWNHSGIQVQEGQQYLFEISKITNWIDGSVISNPIDGWNGWFNRVIGFFSGFLKRSDKVDWYALAGNVGLDEKNSFALFNKGSNIVAIQKNGDLYIYANDMTGRYFNNQGKLFLTITRLNDVK